MKRNVLIMMLFLIVSSFSMRIFAQENLKALVKKCETMPSVDINYVVTDSPYPIKKREVFNITIHGDTALMNEFATAFKKDEENAKDENEKALGISENRQGGKLVSVVYKFMKITYSVQLMGKAEKNTSTSTDMTTK